jgi:di/tricarboxylate transporter
MKQTITIAFIVVFLILVLGILVEVVNPHSFLSTQGAFLRAIVLAVAIGPWVWFSKKIGGRHLLISGIALLFFSACAYALYGVADVIEHLRY